MNHWEDDIEFRKKDPDIDYAYITGLNETPVVCTREELLEAIEEEDIMYVATPSHDTFILAGTDYETLQPILKKRIAKAKNDLQLNWLLTSFFGGLLILLALITNGIYNFFEDRANYLFLLVFGVIPLISGTYELRKLKKVNENNYMGEASQIKFDYWIDLKRVYSIYVITGIIALIAVFQLFYGLSESIEISGLVKEKVRQGEYWRLLTATVLHAGLLHILFNASAMFVIGKMLIRVTSLYHFVLVFLVSGFCGSIASLYLIPEQTSVGASGGIMGLIGFLLIFGILLKEKVPRNITKSMFISVILVAAIGIAAYDIIDNAAHLGGFLGGALMGFLMIRKKKNNIPYPTSNFVKIIGFIGILLFIASILVAILPF